MVKHNFPLLYTTHLSVHLSTEKVYSGLRSFLLGVGMFSWFLSGCSPGAQSKNKHINLARNSKLTLDNTFVQQEQTAGNKKG